MIFVGRWGRCRGRRPIRGGLALGIGLAVLIGGVAVAQSALWAADPYATDLLHRLVAPGAPGHPLGTDQLGRDLLSRVLAGFGWSLGIALVATVMGVGLGTAAGLLAGWCTGWPRTMLSRLVDLMIAFPYLVVAIAIVAVVGRGFWPLAVTLGLVSWPVYARVVYAETLSLRARPYVLAARLAGVSAARSVATHVLPGLRPVLRVLCALQFADMLVAESGLSFLGLGAPLGTPTWGNMLSDSRGYLVDAPWLLLAPASAIVLAVVAANLVADGLTDRDRPEPAAKRQGRAVPEGGVVAGGLVGGGLVGRGGPEGAVERLAGAVSERASDCDRAGFRVIRRSIGTTRQVNILDNDHSTRREGTVSRNLTPPGGRTEQPEGTYRDQTPSEGGVSARGGLEAAERFARAVPDAGPADSDLALEVTGMTVRFPGGRAGVEVVRGVSLRLRRGETLGLVGESGAGKTMLGLGLMRLVPEPGEVTGSVRVAGCDVLGAGERQLRRLRGSQVAMVFQDPMTALNPVRSVGSLLVESIRRHSGGTTAGARDSAVRALRLLGMPDAEERMRAYPHLLSGGLRQRAMIALALVNSPALLIADEPTTGLDATIQAQLLDLLRDRAARRSGALLLITHDLGVAAEVCDRIAVLYAGRIVEIGPTRSLLDAPRHPYTRGLLDARPRLLLGAGRAALRPIPGQPPAPDAGLIGCRFAPRCPLAGPECLVDEPVLRRVGEVEVACVRAEQSDG